MKKLFSVLAVVCLVVFGVFVYRTKADASPLTIYSLGGQWRLSFAGTTGCGYGTQVSDISMNTSGYGSVPTGQAKFHTQGCGDGYSTGPTQFIVQTLNPDGTGTGNLSCGPGCGWELELQLSRNGDVFSFTGVDFGNPGNFVSGTVIKKTSGTGD